MELRDYLRVILARKWIIIQSLIIITAAALIFSFTQKPVYEAKAEIEIEKAGSDVMFSSFPAAYIWNDPDRLLQTHMELIKKDPVADAVAEQLNLDVGPKELLGKIEVSQVKQTDIVAITANDTNPKKARNIANAFAQEYIRLSKAQNVEEITVARKQVYQKLQETKDSIIEIGQRLSDNPDWQNLPPDLRSDWDITTNLYVTLSQNYEQLRIDEALKGGGASLIDPADIPIFPVRPKPVQNGLIALAVGLVFGTGLAFLIEYLDNTIKTKGDIEQITKKPVIGQIPAILNNQHQDSLVTLSESNSIISEAYRTLRTNTQFLNYDHAVKKILISSPGPKEGKTTTVANLAVTLAQAGQNVTILCCDLRKPKIHDFFHLDNSVGLSNVLLGKVDIEEVIQKTAIPNLQIITAGPVPPNPAELLGSNKMKEIFKLTCDSCDICLIDSPPALSITDAAVLASLVDGVVLVNSANLTTREMLKETIALFENINVEILGLVLCNTKPITEYGKYRRYSYRYYQQGEDRGKKSKKAKSAI